MSSAPADAGPPAPQVVTASPEDVARLERVEAELQAQTARLDGMVQQLEQLRSAYDAQRAEVEAAQRRVQSQQEAAVTLGEVDAQLITGDTDVGRTLEGVAATLGPSGRANLSAAQQALANEDLALARYYLALAAADAQAGR